METVTAQCQRIHNKADGQRRGTGRAKFFFLNTRFILGNILIEKSKISYCTSLSEIWRNLIVF